MPQRIGSAARPVSLRSILRRPAHPELVEGGRGRRGHAGFKVGGETQRPWPGTFARLRGNRYRRWRLAAPRKGSPRRSRVPADLLSPLPHPRTEPGPFAQLRPGHSLQSRARPSLRHQWRRVGRAIHIAFHGVTVRLATGSLPSRKHPSRRWPMPPRAKANASAPPPLGGGWVGVTEARLKSRHLPTGAIVNAAGTTPPAAVS